VPQAEAQIDQRAEFVERCRVRAVGPGDQLRPVDRKGKPIEYVTETVGGISHRQSRTCAGKHPRAVL